MIKTDCQTSEFERYDLVQATDENLDKWETVITVNEDREIVLPSRAGNPPIITNIDDAVELFKTAIIKLE